MRALNALGFALLASACASTFKLSDDQLSRRGQFSNDSASTALAHFLAPADSKGGLCRQVDPYARLPVAKPAIRDGVVSFMASKEDIVAKALVGRGLIGLALADSDLQTLKPYAVDLKNLRKSQVIEPKDRGGSSCPPLDWSAVIVSPKEGPFFYVIVEPKDVDEVVTLVSFFSPEAKLMSGPGW
jgi:hypothetical protein